MSLLPPAHGLSHQAPAVLRNEALLVRIFAIVVECDRLSLPPPHIYTAGHVLSLVCRAWHRAALDTPQLWRFIRIDCSRLRSSIDLSLCQLSVRNSVELSRGTVHRVSLCHFPGPTPALAGSFAFWRYVIPRTLSLCEELYVCINAQDTNARAYPYHAHIQSIVSTIACCIGPRITLLNITCGHFALPPTVRYRLDIPLLAPGRMPRLDSLTTNCIQLGDYVQPHTRCIAELVFSGGSYHEVDFIISANQRSLQRLVLVDVDFRLDTLDLSCLPSLRSLTIDQSMIRLLACLRFTLLPQLAYMAIIYKGAGTAARQLTAFVNLHPESSIISLSLRNAASIPSFAAFLPSLQAMRRLRAIRLGVGVEPEFFLNLTRIMPQDFWKRLDELIIQYDHPLDYLVPSLFEFLFTGATMSGCYRLSKLYLIGASPLSLPPFDYSTTVKLSEMVQPGGFLIEYRSASELLVDIDYWLPRRFLLIAGSLFLPILIYACMIPIGVIETAGQMWTTHAIWLLIICKDIYSAYMDNLPALYAGRSCSITWQLVRAGEALRLLVHSWRELRQRILLFTIAYLLNLAASRLPMV